MRYGIVSDVHGNLPALEAALAELDRQRVDRVICAGDVVGYGPWPDECAARIAAEGIDCVAGNHDLMAIERLTMDSADGLARTTMEWTRTAISDATRAFLGGLPPRIELADLTMAHGTLTDPTVYVRTDEAAAGQVEELVSAGLPDPLVIGHTHVPHAYGRARGRLLHARAGEVELAAGEAHLLNPGSVGQARERRPLARLLVLDTDASSASFLALSYDERRTRSALASAGLPPSAHHRKVTLRDRAARAKGAVVRRLPR